METFLPIVKDLGIGVSMVIYLMWMFNKQNKQREFDFKAQIERWTAHEATLNARIDKLEKHNEEQDVYIRQTLSELVKVTHAYFQKLDASFEKLCDKIGQLR